MAIRKVEDATNPPVLEVLSVTKTNYRSGKRFHVTVRCCWDITPVGPKFRYYTETISVGYDWASESIDQLKAKVLAQYQALVAADRSEANLVFNLEKAELHL
jgi:hypothetical protein